MSTSPISRRAGRKSQNSIDNSKDSPLKTSSSLGGVRSLARAESREASNFEISNKDGGIGSYKHSASNEKKSKGDVLTSASAINKNKPNSKSFWGPTLRRAYATIMGKRVNKRCFKILQKAEQDIKTGKRKSVFGNNMLLDPMGSVTEGDDAVLAQSELDGKEEKADEEKDAMSNMSDIDSTTDSVTGDVGGLR